MDGKKKESYQKVFDFLKSEHPDLSPQVAMADYEKGLRWAIREVFGDTIDIRGCYFHYDKVE